MHDIEEIQRFYVVTVSEGSRRKYRLFLIGPKKLPEIVECRSTSLRKEIGHSISFFTTTTTDNPDDDIFVGAPFAYGYEETETRGKRRRCASWRGEKVGGKVSGTHCIAGFLQKN